MARFLSEADEGGCRKVLEPDGRTTRFFLGAWPAGHARVMSEPAPASRVRDVLVLTVAGESAEACYAARQETQPSSVSEPGRFAVIDATAPDRVRLLRDGWAFSYDARREEGDAWLRDCAASVEAGYALHDALCLALAQGACSDVRTSPSLAAFPGVAAPCRIVGRPREEKIAESPFDETAALAAPTAFAIDPASASTQRAEASRDFPRCAAALGLYPIAPSADWVRRLIDAGARTIQLRIKSDALPEASQPADAANGPASESATNSALNRIAHDDALRDEIQRAVTYCRAAPEPVQLFINDHWRMAIDAGAYGLHLGQEDLAALPGFALDAIASAGLRLGLSTHGYYEMLLALRFRPSYIACGPVFATATKSVAVPPQGLQRLEAYCRLLREAQPAVPVVAIGGLGLAQLAAVRAAGADSAAVVSALVNRLTAMDGNALKQRVSALQVAFNG